MMGKPDCYKCVHRGPVLGDAHSCCEHPKASVVAIFTGDNPLGIKAARRGIEMGWFVWPANFDPVWLEACNGFEAKPAAAEQPAEVSRA